MRRELFEINYCGDWEELGNGEKKGNKLVARLGVSPKLSYFWSVLQKRTIILYSCPCLHLNHFCSQGVPGGAERGLEVLWQDWWSILIVNNIGSLEALVYPTGTIYFSKKPDSFQPPSSSSFMNVLNSEHEGFCLSCSFTGLAARLRSTKTNRNAHFFVIIVITEVCCRGILIPAEHELNLQIVWDCGNICKEYMIHGKKQKTTQFCWEIYSQH